MSEVRHQKSERYVRTGAVAMESGGNLRRESGRYLEVRTQRASPVRVDATHHSSLITHHFYPSEVPTKCLRNSDAQLSVRRRQENRRARRRSSPRVFPRRRSKTHS